MFASRQEFAIFGIYGLLFLLCMVFAICTMRFYVLDCDAKKIKAITIYLVAADVRTTHVWSGSHWPVDGRETSLSVYCTYTTHTHTVRSMNINWKCKQQQCNQFCVLIYISIRVEFTLEHSNWHLSALFASFRKSVYQHHSHHQHYKQSSYEVA